MKTKTALKILFACTLLVFLFSCDPPYYIDFVNNSNSNAKVRLNLNHKNENYRLKDLAMGDSIVFNLNKKEISRISFGIGQWSDSEIQNIVKSIKNIQIETNDVKIIYKNKNSIQNLFIKNREGLILRSKIEIEIK
jgi:hypothetical protein